MPFGFERNIEAENKSAQQMNVNKQFISVCASYMPDGKIVPRSFVFDDMEYNIDKVINCRLGSSLKNSAAGFRYLCQVKNKRFYLYFTGKQWYMEM